MSKNSFRNRLANRIANAAFVWIADDEYEGEIFTYMDYGIRSAIRDHREDRERPPTLTELGLPEWSHRV